MYKLRKNIFICKNVAHAWGNKIVKWEASRYKTFTRKWSLIFKKMLTKLDAATQQLR